MKQILLSFTCALMLLLLPIHLAAQGKARSNTGALMPPKISVDVTLKDANNDGALEPDEPAKVVVLLSNSGGETRNIALRLFALQFVPGLSNDSVFAVKSLAFGENREVSFDVALDDDAGLTKATMRVLVDGLPSIERTTKDIEIPLKAVAGPELTIDNCKLNGNDCRSRDAYAQRGDEALVGLGIKNVGKRSAKSLTVKVSCDDPAVTIKSTSGFTLDELAPGESRNLQVWMLPTKKFVADSVYLDVQITERRAKFSRRHQVAFPISKPSVRARRR